MVIVNDNSTYKMDANVLNVRNNRSTSSGVTIPTKLSKVRTGAAARLVFFCFTAMMMTASDLGLRMWSDQPSWWFCTWIPQVKSRKTEYPWAASISHTFYEQIQSCKLSLLHRSLNIVTYFIVYCNKNLGEAANLCSVLVLAFSVLPSTSLVIWLCWPLLSTGQWNVQCFNIVTSF